MQIMHLALESKNLEQEYLDADKACLVLEDEISAAISLFNKLTIENTGTSSLAVEGERFGVKINSVKVDHTLSLEALSGGIIALAIAAAAAVAAFLYKLIGWLFGGSSSGGGGSGGSPGSVIEKIELDIDEIIETDKVITDTVHHDLSPVIISIERSPELQVEVNEIIEEKLVNCTYAGYSFLSDTHNSTIYKFLKLLPDFKKLISNEDVMSLEIDDLIDKINFESNEQQFIEYAISGLKITSALVDDEESNRLFKELKYKTENINNSEYEKNYSAKIDFKKFYTALKDSHYAIGNGTFASDLDELNHIIKPMLEKRAASTDKVSKILKDIENKENINAKYIMLLREQLANNRFISNTVAKLIKTFELCINLINKALKSFNIISINIAKKAVKYQDA